MLITSQTSKVLCSVVLRHLFTKSGSIRNICKISQMCISSTVYSHNKILFHTSSSLNENIYKNTTLKPLSVAELKLAAKKAREKVTYVTLIGVDNNITVTTLEEATKISKRRNLKLVQVKDYDTKTDRCTYQLMTPEQFLVDEKKQKTRVKEQKKQSFTKGSKLISFSSKISDHDLDSKIKNIMKWIAKRNEVNVSVSNVDGKGEEIYNKIATQISDNGRILQKHEKAGNVRFQIVPPKDKDVSPSSKE